MSPDVLNISTLVFREGLEAVLVLAAVAASLVGPMARHRGPIAVGACVGLAATLLTWVGAIRVVDDLSARTSALHIQAATGLVAVVVLLVVMNWFFHRTYWTGWITLHTNRKRALIAGEQEFSRPRLLLGLALLGFTSIYREGVEVVLFLQSYRLRLGEAPIRTGAALGVAATLVVGWLTFVVHRRLPYRRMLVITGIMLGFVLFVMVGEQAQEMQLAHWLTTTNLPRLAAYLPAWTGVWLSLFPTIETLGAQAVAVATVIVSYRLAGHTPETRGA